MVKRLPILVFLINFEIAINAFEQQKQKYSVFMIACIFCESKFVYLIIVSLKIIHEAYLNIMIYVYLISSVMLILSFRRYSTVSRYPSNSK